VRSGRKRWGILTEQSNDTDDKKSQDGANSLAARDNDDVIAGRRSVLADSRLNVRGDVEGAVAEASAVSSLAGLDESTRSIAASLVDSGALNTALLVGAGRAGAARVVAALGVGVVARVRVALGVAASLVGVVAVAVRLGVAARVITVLANSRLDVGGDVEGAVSKAGGVLGLASLNVVAISGAALVVDSGALDTALLLRAGAAGRVVIVAVRVGARVVAGVISVLADGGLDVGDNGEGVVAEADSVRLLADSDISTRNRAALIVDSGALDTALLNINVDLGVLVAGVVRASVLVASVVGVSVLADSGLHIGGNIEGAVSEADGVLLLADLNVGASNLAAFIVDGGALNAALLNIDLNIVVLVLVVVVLGVVVFLTVLGLVLRVVALLVLADSGLVERNDLEGVVSEADGVGLLADSDISTRNRAALIVDSGALGAAVLGSVVTLVVRRGRVRRRLVVAAVLLLEVVAVVLGLVLDVVALVVLADGLSERNRVERAVTKADSVLLLADLDISTLNAAALLVDSGALNTTDLRGEAATSATLARATTVVRRLRLVVADSGRDVRVRVEGAVAETNGVSLLTNSDVGTRDGTALVVDGSTLDAADLGADRGGRLGHGGHGGHGGGQGDNVGELRRGDEVGGDRGGHVHTTRCRDVGGDRTRSALGKASGTHGHGQKTGQSVGVSHLGSKIEIRGEKRVWLSWVKNKKLEKSECGVG
jgi:hypothetical protein